MTTQAERWPQRRSVWMTIAACLLSTRQGSSDAHTGLIVRMRSGSTANALEIQDSTSTVKASITKAGAATVASLTFNGTGAGVLTSNTAITGSDDNAFVFDSVNALSGGAGNHTDAIVSMRNQGTEVHRFYASGRILCTSPNNNGQPGFYFATPSGGKAVFRLAGGSGELAQLYSDGGVTEMQLGQNIATAKIGPNLTELLVTGSLVKTNLGLRANYSNTTRPAASSTYRGRDLVRRVCFRNSRSPVGLREEIRRQHMPGST
jgi:hypothetical protein